MHAFTKSGTSTSSSLPARATSSSSPPCIRVHGFRDSDCDRQRTLLAPPTFSAPYKPHRTPRPQHPSLIRRKRPTSAQVPPDEACFLPAIMHRVRWDSIPLFSTRTNVFSSSSLDLPHGSSPHSLHESCRRLPSLPSSALSLRYCTVLSACYDVWQRLHTT
ncbi:hypothetical protein DFP72DRAFT_265089 [Ephemerocybe angulata]|uniref:Uncharacterized protein n=1 Tax=Ephemerocybe angulata TaxID=980116 RepID=A0A8H6I148_9AGAR|nr:hypothetical protein DFP72DRAFT_265089 [Tulosesus angulatus]